MLFGQISGARAPEVQSEKVRAAARRSGTCLLAKRPSSRHFCCRRFLAPLLANIGHLTRNAINLPAFLLARHSMKACPLSVQHRARAEINHHRGLKSWQGLAFPAERKARQAPVLKLALSVQCRVSWKLLHFHTESGKKKLIFAADARNGSATSLTPAVVGLGHDWDGSSNNCRGQSLAHRSPWSQQCGRQCHRRPHPGFLHTFQLTGWRGSGG